MVCRARVTQVFLPLSGLAGCATILDIEEARVDERAAAKEHGGTQLTDAAASGGGSGAAGSPAAAGAPGIAGATSADGGDAVTLCERYCALVATNCTGAFAQYTAEENCLAGCQALPEGEPSAESGNSVHCRLRNAELAPTEPPTYCEVAGPSGGGVCGTLCEAFCTFMHTACPIGYYPDDAACTLECSALPDIGSYSFDPDRAMFRGETAQCRLYHVNAALLDANFHCPHAFGGLPCADENADY